MCLIAGGTVRPRPGAFTRAGGRAYNGVSAAETGRSTAVLLESKPMLALFTTGGYEWVIILIVALLLFGRRLPEVMRSMGQGIRQFKKGLHEVEEDIEAADVEGAAEGKRLPESKSGSGSSPAG